MITSFRLYKEKYEGSGIKELAERISWILTKYTNNTVCVQRIIDGEGYEVLMSIPNVKPLRFKSVFLFKEDLSWLTFDVDFGNKKDKDFELIMFIYNKIKCNSEWRPFITREDIPKILDALCDDEVSEFINSKKFGL